MFICLTTLQSINSNPGYLAMRYENLYSQNTCTKAVHGSLIPNSSKLEMTQISINRKMDKHCGNSQNISQEKKEWTDIFNNMNQSQKHYTKRSEIQDYILYESIYIKFKNRLS